MPILTYHMGILKPKKAKAERDDYLARKEALSSIVSTIIRQRNMLGISQREFAACAESHSHPLSGEE